MQVTANYPGDAVGGADFLSGSAVGEIIVNDERRPERVVITDLYRDHEGRVCIGERSVRHMANMLGMYDGDRVALIAADNDALRRELEAQQAIVARLQNEIAGLEAGAPEPVYVGADGNTYATLEGARAANTPPVQVVPVPDPELEDAEDQADNPDGDSGGAPEPKKEPAKKAAKKATKAVKK